MFNFNQNPIDNTKNNKFASKILFDNLLFTSKIALISKFLTYKNLEDEF